MRPCAVRVSSDSYDIFVSSVKFWSIGGHLGALGLPVKASLYNLGSGTDQSLPPELAVVSDPPVPLVIPLRPHNCSLISKEFWGLVGEAGGQECRHHRESLHPLGDLRDREASWG